MNWAKIVVTGLTVSVVVSIGGASYARTLTSSAGHDYSESVNANGTILTSVYPISRATGGGAEIQYFKSIEKLYLGKDCDAFNSLFGSGTWGWANGGFIVSFSGIEIAFGRQELLLAPSKCGL